MPMLQKTVGASNYIALGLFRSKKEVGVKEVKEHNTVAHKCMKVPTEQNCAFYTNRGSTSLLLNAPACVSFHMDDVKSI